MPLFFFISGYLEKNRTLKETFLKGIKTIIIPYILLYCLYYVWWFPVSLVRHPEIFGKISLENAVIKPFLGMVFGVGYNTDISTMINVPLWFLAGLFFCKVFHCILKNILKGNYLLMFLLTGVIIGINYFIKNTEIDLYLSIDSALMALPFFIIGNFFGEKGLFAGQNTVNMKKSFMLFFLAIIGYIILIVIVPINGRVDINGFGYGNNILLFYIIGMVGIISTILFSQIYIKKIKIIEIMANGTMIIMAFHGVIASIILRIIGLRSEDIIINPLIASIVSLITVFVFIYPTIIVKKYFPILIGGHK
jgi:fucose 4-O-acetylase-like acetyltransferase